MKKSQQKRYEVSMLPDNYSIKEKDKFLANLRVQKGRLKDGLENYGYTLDKDFYIMKKYFSVENTVDNINETLKNIRIKELKIFDFYLNKDKDKFLNSDRKKELLKILTKKGTVKVLSNFDSSATRDFYKKLLLTSDKKEYDFSVKYLSKNILDNLSLIYCLISDMYDNKYIIYYEDSISWYYFSKITLENEASYNFYNLLKNRFDYLFSNEKLKKSNSVISVDVEVFELDFDDEVLFITEKINTILSKNALSVDNIESEMYNLDLLYKNLRIAFPRSKYGSSILLHYIELIKIIYQLKKDSMLVKSRKVIRTLFSKKFNDSFSINIRSIIDKDDYLIFEEDIKEEDINSLKQKIHIKKLHNEKYLSEVFNEFVWNDKNSIIISFNRILLHNELCFKFINLFIYGYSKDKLKKDIPFLRAMVRIILKNYHIKYEYSGITKSRMEIVSELQYLDSKIYNIFREC